MATTSVFVYAIDRDRRTGDFLGRGSLLNPWFVVLDQTASDRVLAGPDDYPELRCQIVPSGGPVHTFDGELAEPVIDGVPAAAFLYYASGARPDPIQWDQAGEGRAGYRSAVTALLDAGLGDGAPPAPPIGADVGDSTGRDGEPAPSSGGPASFSSGPAADARRASKPPWCFLWRKGPGCAG